MPNSDRFKLLRSGTVRVVRHGMGRGVRYGASEPLAVVPNIEECGHQPFLEADLEALAKRLLQNPRRTRGTRDIYGLEGLLTALLVLPLGLRLGTWLPLVWGEGGWKVPVALQGAEHSRTFVDLTVGFMRAIDAGFSAAPPRFASVVEALAPRYGVKATHAQKAWAHGFGLAVAEARYLEVPFDPATQRSLLTIAMFLTPATNPSVPGRKSRVTLEEAVLGLAKRRTSRGPLGLLN